MHPRFPFLAGLLAITLMPASASAATLTWPGGPGCTGTLQACIDAAIDNDRIQIATDAPITQAIAIQGKSLTLTAAAGYTPLVQGVGITINNAGGSGDLTVRISRMHIEDGYVRASYEGSGTAVFDLRELVMTHTSAAISNPLQVLAYGGTVEAMLYNNRISGRPNSLNGGLIRLAAQGGTLDADAFYNHLTTETTERVEGSGILVDFAGIGGVAAGGTVKLHANEVRGSFRRAGIFVSEGLLSSTPSTLAARLYSNVVVGTGNGIDAGAGINLTPKDGHIDAQLFNNTITRVHTGIYATNWDGASTPAVSGLVYNNLVRAERAMFVNPGVASGVTNDYNLFNGTVVNFTPGPNTITAPAALVSDAQPRLTAASPAIDAADTVRLGLGLIVNGLPTTDADGLRRLKRLTTTGATKADIGAYEYGDLSLVHHTRADTVVAHTSIIDDPILNGRPEVNLFGVPNFNGSDAMAVAYNHAYGFWYPAPNWSVYNQNIGTPMPTGVMLNLFAPAFGTETFRHKTTTASISGFSSELDHSALTNAPDMIVLASQNWAAGTVYNPHPIGVFPFGGFGGSGDSKWFVANLDLTPMPAGTGFNIYYQPPSPNAFRVTQRTAGLTLTLDHPLLNGTPCARLMATRMWDGAASSAHFDAYYIQDVQRWSIFTYETMPAGTQFNVLVDPAQVAECSDRIFADGFD